MPTPTTTPLTNGRAEPWGEGLDVLGDEALQEVNRSWTVSRVVGDAVHAVNNTLQIIGGSAELLDAHGVFDAGTRPRLQTIREQTERAARVLDTVLAYASRRSDERHACDIGRLVEAATLLRSHSLGRRRITVVVEHADGDPFVAFANDGTCLQVLLNLLFLAEWRVADQAQARIRVRLERDEGLVLVIVAATADPATPSGAEAAIVSDEGPLGRVMARLAAGLRAELRREPSETGVTLTLALPTSACTSADVPVAPRQKRRRSRPRRETRA